MPIFVYILKCSNNTFYTGLTYNLNKRILEHKNGFSIFTKRRLPVSLVYCEKLENRIEARKREIKIKDMSQKKKLELISKFTSNEAK